MLKRFLSYVEIMTKITSTFAFLLTLAFLFYKKQPVNWALTLVFFASMFLFDLATTAINNYIDTKTNHQTLQFQRRTALWIILILVFISAGLGIYLVYLTDVVVFLLGGLCFLCGILYTYGPLPISRQPYGEVLSGIFYGLLIPFILLYINMPSGTYLSLGLSWQMVDIRLNVIPILQVLLISIVPMCTTANIMLANNICDLEKDIAVRRYTLPYFLGSKALYLFALIYYVAYTAIVAAVILKVLPYMTLATLLTLPIVQKNISAFFRQQDKQTTFLLSVKNYVILTGTAALSILIGGLLSF